MKLKKFNKLEPGLYEIKWKKSFHTKLSVGVIGTDEEGSRWIACSIMISPEQGKGTNMHTKIKSVIPIVY